MSQSTSGTKIGVATATIIGMNAMIGSGIFAVPAALAANVGPAGILAYLFVIVAVWCMATSFARMAELFPEEGSFYIYTKQWAGHVGGLIAAFAYLCGLTIAMGLLAQMAGAYLQDPFFPTYSKAVLGFITLITLVALNMFGVALSQTGQYVLIVCTVFPLLATTLLCLTKFNVAFLTPFAPFGLGNVLKATKVVIFGFFGFECATSLFSIVRNPQKNVPKALSYSISLVGTIYTLFVGSIMLSMPLSVFSDPNITIPEILRMAFPENNWLVLSIHLAILSAILGTIHSMIWSSSSLLITLVQKIKNQHVQKLLSSGILNSQTSVFIVGTCIFTTFMTLKSIDLFFSLTSIFIVSAFIASMLPLLFMKKEWESHQNIKTVLGLITAVIILAFAVEGLMEGLGKL